MLGGGRGEGRYRGCIMEGGEEKEGTEGTSWRRGEGRCGGCIMEGGEEKKGIEGASWREECMKIIRATE